MSTGFAGGRGFVCELITVVMIGWHNVPVPLASLATGSGEQRGVLVEADVWSGLKKSSRVPRRECRKSLWSVHETLMPHRGFG